MTIHSTRSPREPVWLRRRQHMKIRAYRESDWPRLCEIHDAARMCELSASNLTDAFLTLEQTAENEGLFDGAIVVAEAEGAVQGFAAFSDNELTWLYCHPALAAALHFACRQLRTKFLWRSRHGVACGQFGHHNCGARLIGMGRCWFAVRLP